MSQAPYFVTQNNYGGEFRQFPGLIQAAGPRVQNGDWLALTLTTSDATGSVEINGRILTDAGEIVPFTGAMTFSGTGTQTAVIARLGGGWLQGFDVHRVSGTLTDGEVVAAVHLGTGEGGAARYECCLASGEITNIRSLGMGAYLYSASTVSVTQPTPTILTVANPAAAADWSTTVPAGQVWQISSIFAKFTASAVAGGRRLRISLTDGTDAIALVGLANSFVASETVWINCAPGIPPSINAFSTGYMVTLGIGPVTLPSGSTIQGIIEFPQAGDQWSNIRIAYNLRNV